VEVDHLFKHSCRERRHLIVVKPTETINPQQNHHSQLLELGQVIKHSCREKRQLIVLKIAKTVNPQ
jgi:hypothetical protein